MNELTKSIKAVLYERIVSPLAGSFAIAWLVWNWKIVYITFFISEDKISGTRIDYIINNSDELNLVWAPMVSTAIIITIFPLFSYLAYWVSLEYKKLNIDKRNKVEGATLLTKQQSLDIRRELRDELDRYNNIINGKEHKISELKAEIENLQLLIKPNIEKIKIQQSENNKIQKQLDDLLEKQAVDSIDVLELTQIKLKDILERHTNKDYFIKDFIKRDIKKPTSIDGFNSSVILDFFIKNSMVTDVGDKYYIMTKKGDDFLKYFLAKEKEYLGI